ncbi:WGxxGxxG family protein [Paenibacillus sabuli]|nr:WGxxGxxG family protein [Paenibacillus sabuli]
MKRLSISFMLVAALMLVLSLPTFAATGKMDGMSQSSTKSKSHMNGTSTMDRNSMDRTPATGNTMNRYDHVSTDGNYGNYDNRYGATSVGMNNQRYRTTATTDNNRMNWGWLGLLGLIGLAGMRGRNREVSDR